MLGDILEVLQEYVKKIISSRIFVLGIICIIMFSNLLHTLFVMQIINGAEAQSEYMQLTEQTLSTAGTRGNIYDRNGKILAYNKLAYSVTIQDVGAYPKSSGRNSMLLKLVEILNKHEETVQGKFELAINSEGEMVYTSSSETARKRFLADYYGLKSIDQLDDSDNKYPSNLTARELFEKVKKDIELDKMKDAQENPILISDELALDMMNVQYSLRLMSYRKYESTVVSAQVSDETVADILEHAADLKGVNIEESTIRAYNYSVSFAPVIGYTGKIQKEQLEELQTKRADYDLNDIVGITGIEAAMENDLQGTKGKKTIYKDSVGRVRETTGETPAWAGNNTYLTLDADLQEGIYHLVEQSLAGILVKTLVNGEVDISDTTDASKIRIPIKDAYFQLINNNVLSLKSMASEEPSEIERLIHGKYLSSQEQILSNIRDELLSSHPTMMKDLPQSMNAYMVYIYNYLSDPTVGIIQKDNVDVNSDSYQAWKNDVISLREFIYAGIAQGWIDTTKLDTDTKYSSADDTFQALVDYVLENLKNDGKFTKKIYRYLINDGVITGRELCLALYAQGVLTEDLQAIAELTANGENYAYSFLLSKISSLEITPAQLALDPCTAGVVVTNVNTGEVLALVSYPGYDNNQIGDGFYFNQLQEDMSLPLYNNATQAAKAPGSTFKPITAVAALEEGIIASPYDKIDCTGLYEQVEPPIRCAIYPYHHGELNLMGAIGNSCNYYFAELAHRMSTDENGGYSPDKGTHIIRKYASLFGLDRKSGVEILEKEPHLTTSDPERSSMGQGDHSYTNVQLSRYVAAVANRGTVFDLSLIDKVTDSQENLVKDYTPEVSSHIEAADITWDAVQTGMRSVVSDGTARKLFQDLEVDIAAKTGTAQETRTRGNHAFFVSFAPYENPEICVTVNIPYGYTSSNAAIIAKRIYRYYYGYTDLDTILKAGALDAAGETIRD